MASSLVSEQNSVVIRTPIEIKLEIGPTQIASLAKSTELARASATDDSLAESTVAPGLQETAYSKFDGRAFHSSTFSWQAALTSCVASHLVYEEPTYVERTCKNRFGLSCRFLESNATQCFVAHDNRLVLVAFRGSQGVADWIANLKVSSRPTTIGNIHSGFYEAFQDVRTALDNLIEPLIDNRILIFTGHSLGGAVAAIAAAYWHRKYNIRAVYTFGQPRVGLNSFRAYVKDNRIDQAFYRIVNADDIVSRIPPRYAHVGHHFRFNAQGVASQLEGVPPEVSTSERPSLSFEEFETLRTACEYASNAQVEALFPNYFGDHRLQGYLAKILKQVQSAENS